MSTKGWNSLKPITTPDQMSAPIHWNPMNEDWKMRLTKSQIYNTSSGFDTQTLDAMKKLHDKILTFGGDEVCMTMFDEDAPNCRFLAKRYLCNSSRVSHCQFLKGCFGGSFFILRISLDFSQTNLKPLW